MITTEQLTEAIETIQYLRSEAKRQSEISVWFVADMCDQALEQLKPDDTETSATRKLAVAMEWYQHFTKRGNAHAAAVELETACKYAAELLSRDEVAA